MRLLNFLYILFALLITWSTTCTGNAKKPTILVAILIRNKAHTLPYFFSFFERLNYPKKRMHLWIRSDNNVDNSIEILNTWLESEGKNYHGVDIEIDEESKGFEDETGIADWSPQRFLHVINLREEAVNYGRNMWADFVWMLDADVFLINPDTLSELVSKNETVVAPMLKSDGMYSNFWAGITKEYYYFRTERYEPILFREETGCFNVSMVHSAVLLDLRKANSDLLSYDAKNIARYDGPTDDIITFAIGANRSGKCSLRPLRTVDKLPAAVNNVPLFVCNDNIYGFIMVPLENEETVVEDMRRLTNIKVEILAYNDYLPLSKTLERFVMRSNEAIPGLDNIYMINLLRRPERRRRMYRLFKELGIRPEAVDAVDGRTLNELTLQKWGVEIMPEYADPYHERPMTMGEIGCFLSHYVIWNKVIQNGQEHVMVLEDDVRFEPFFNQKVKFILAELDSLQIDWDLVYLGRKRLVEKAESWIEGSKYLVRAAYSYWTLGYLLSASGAKKLVDAEPLKKLIPVDEYLPVLSDAHPREDWKEQYPKRDLIVLSAHPLLIHPTHYTGDHGYISDTENSKIVDDTFQANKLQEREEL